MEMLEMVSVFLARGGWGLLKRNCYPNQSAYWNATSRLRKNGLIVNWSGDGKTPQLKLTDAGRNALPDYFFPERLWSRKWEGIWYMLVYDVPEVDRQYRDVLRLFLKRMRMGCLQQSVWVTPQDIRPDFDDLTKAASVDAFAFLFEARTVLGLPSRRVAEEAWNFGRLDRLQDRYCEVMEANINLLNRNECTAEELGKLMRMALNAYHAAFAEDPLLPLSLYPSGYHGREVLTLHRKLMATLDERTDPVIQPYGRENR